MCMPPFMTPKCFTIIFTLHNYQCSSRDACILFISAITIFSSRTVLAPCVLVFQTLALCPLHRYNSLDFRGPTTLQVSPHSRPICKRGPLEGDKETERILTVIAFGDLSNLCSPHRHVQHWPLRISAVVSTNLS